MQKKKQEPAVRQQLIAYAEKFGLTITSPGETIDLLTAADREYGFIHPRFQILAEKQAKKTVRRLAAGLSAISFLILVILNITHYFHQKDTLTRLKSQRKLLMEKLQVAQTATAKTKLPEGTNYSVHKIVTRLSKLIGADYPVKRFRLQAGQALLYYRDLDPLKISQIKDTLEREPMFYDFNIEDGIEGNDTRLVFKIKE